jgi:hypothetical protein
MPINHVTEVASCIIDFSFIFFIKGWSENNGHCFLKLKSIEVFNGTKPVNG